MLPVLLPQLYGEHNEQVIRAATDLLWFAHDHGHGHGRDEPMLDEEWVLIFVLVSLIWAVLRLVINVKLICISQSTYEYSDLLSIIIFSSNQSRVLRMRIDNQVPNKAKGDR